MNRFAAASEYARCRFIYFDDYSFRFFCDLFRCRYGRTEREEAVLVHGTDRYHGDVHVKDIPVHGRLVAVAHGNKII